MQNPELLYISHKANNRADLITSTQEISKFGKAEKEIINFKFKPERLDNFRQNMFMSPS